MADVARTSKEGRAKGETGVKFMSDRFERLVAANRVLNCHDSRPALSALSATDDDPTGAWLGVQNSESRVTTALTAKPDLVFGIRR